MEAVFLKLLNMSITASWLILAVLILRLILKKAPKFISCILWGLVGLRLLLPFSIESALSLIPSSEPLPKDFIYTATPTVNTGITVIDNVIEPIIEQSLTPDPELLTSINPTQVLSLIASSVWICGLILMLGYMLVSYLRVRIKVREAVLFHNNVYFCDHIASPFILGIIRPKIYLPSNMSASDAEYVIRHENAHLKRRDHWWKPFGFLLLSVYWFNPVIWLGYVFLCRDIELACDEKVIGQMDTQDKKAYSSVLLACSTPRKIISACPLAFGESGVKTRVKSILNYKKPAFWIILIAVIVSIAAAVCFLTDPQSGDMTDPVSDENKSIATLSKEDYVSVSKVTYGTDAPEDKVQIEFKSAVVHTDKDNLVIEWKNHTDSSLILENNWIFCKQVEGKWENIRYLQEFKTVGSTHHGARESFEESYSLTSNYFTSDKNYRFEQEFSLKDSPDTKYTAYVEFEINYTQLPLGIYSEYTDEEGYSHSSTSGGGIVFGDFEYTAQCYYGLNYKFTDLRDGKLYIEFLEPLSYEGKEITEFAIDYGEKELLISQKGERFTFMFPSERARFSKTTTGGVDSPITLYESALAASAYFDGNDSLFTDSLNVNRKYVDKLNHQPIRKIESYGELESFTADYKDKLALNEETNDHRSFTETVEKYNEEFFENNILFVVYVQSKNKHTSFFNIASVYNDGETFCVNLTEKSYSAEEGEKSGLIAVVATSRKDIETCKVIDAVLETVSYDMKITDTSDLDHTHEFGRFDDLYRNGYFHTAPSPYIDHMGEYIDVETEGEIFRVWESDAVNIRDFLKNAPYDTEKVCDCPCEVKVVTSVEGQPAEFEVNLSLAFARCDKGQISLSEKQVADIMSYLTRLYPEHGEDYQYPEDHTHSLSAYPILREDVNYIQSVGDSFYPNSMVKDSVVYLFTASQYTSLYNILNNAYYDENEVCDCPAEFTVLSDRYEVNLTHGFARCNEGQVKLTPHQINAMKSVFENMMTKEEYNIYLSELLQKNNLPLIGSKYIKYKPINP